MLASTASGTTDAGPTASRTTHHLKHLAAPLQYQNCSTTRTTAPNNDLEKGYPVNALRHRLSLAGTRDAGFSLIEVVVALFVFTIIATGTAYALLSVIQLNRDSRVRHVAANLAAEEIDLAHGAADIITLGDLARDRVLGTDTFHITRTTAWVASTGTDDALYESTCGGVMPAGICFRTVCEIAVTCA